MDILHAADAVDAVVFDKAGNLLDRNGDIVPHMPSVGDFLKAEGVYHAKCFDKDGHLLWEDEAHNTVVVPGKNFLLNTFFAGSSYTTTGPFMGVISSTSFTAISSTDTMSSHSGWLEAGSANAPTYSGNRPTAVFASASGGAIALSAALSFSITGTGTLKGCFIVTGSGAVDTVGDTAGTLFSAGLFSAGDVPVVNTNVVQINYSVSV